MENYNLSSAEAEKLYRKFIQGRMTELDLTVYQLSKSTGITEANLHRWLNGESRIMLHNLFKICGALKLRPYIIPAESDDTEMNRIFFN